MEALATQLRQSVEFLLEQGYQKEDYDQVREITVALGIQMLAAIEDADVLGSYMEILDSAKQAAAKRDWETATPQILALLARLRIIERMLKDNSN